MLWQIPLPYAHRPETRQPPSARRAIPFGANVPASMGRLSAKIRLTTLGARKPDNLL
jgi:hypothetical protein